MARTLPPLPSPAVFDIYEKSAETMEALRQNIKIGFTDERGPAWWANGAVTKAGNWTTIPDGSHFDGPVPIDVVRAQLDVPLVKAERTSVRYRGEDGKLHTVVDPNVAPIINARTGQIFGYPTDSYRIHPYLQTLHTFIEQILHDERVAVGSVGLLKKGGVAFLQAVLPEHYEVAGYGFQPYITGVTSADSSRVTSWSTGAKGAVCDNTVDTALREALTQLKVRHTKNSDVKVQAAREKLGIRLVQTAEEITAIIDGLVNVEVSEKEFAAWLDLTVPVPEKDEKSPTGGRGYSFAVNKRDRLAELRTDPKVAPWDGTGWGIVQLDNTDRTWNGIVRNADYGRLERNFTNDVFGLTAKADLKALDALATVKGRKLVLA
jgi:phage/plasmid-like protein (TIGR03299 family)